MLSQASLHSLSGRIVLISHSNHCERGITLPNFIFSLASASQSIHNKMNDLQEEQIDHINNKVEEEPELIWYFAIGCMMNPTSCALREFYPKESHPAKLLDYEIQFFSSMGFAEAVARQRVI